MTFPPVTLNEAVREPCGTVIDAGNVTAEEGLADRVTFAPPARAAAVNVTVQAELAPAANVTGLHMNPLSPGSMVTVPAEVDVPMVPPEAFAAEMLASRSWEEESVV